MHRDIKPSNILLDDAGRAVLTDFDLARADGSTQGTRSGALGTFIYAAPEQLKDASRVDARADIYSIGLTVLFVLGRRDPPALVARVEPEYFDELEWGPELRHAVETAVAYRVEDRTITCSELGEAIRTQLAKPAAAVVSTPAKMLEPAGPEPAHPAKPTTPLVEVAEEPAAPAPEPTPKLSPAPVAAVPDELATPEPHSVPAAEPTLQASVSDTWQPTPRSWLWPLGIRVLFVAVIMCFSFAAKPSDKKLCEHILKLTIALATEEAVKNALEQCEKEMRHQRELRGDAFDERAACIMKTKASHELLKCE